MAQYLGFRSRLAFAAGVTAAAAVVSACAPSATVAPAVATTLKAAVASLNQVGTVGRALASPLTVVLTDQDGAAMSGVTVTFAVVSGGGTLSAASAVTDADGQASASLILGTVAGADSVIATASGLSAMFAATATPDVAVALIKVSGDAQQVAMGTTAAALVVKAVDQYGNAVAGAGVTWSVSGGQLSAASTVTGSDGLATIMLLVEQEAVEVVAALADDSSVAATFSIIGM